MVLTLLFIAPATVLAGGFDSFGYNYTARMFNGTGMQWCNKLGITSSSACDDALGGPFSNDKLVMKWSKAWDDARFNGAPWTPDAWVNNEWNGMMPDGSSSVWHYKIVWVGPELQNSPYWRAGGEPVWGEFEIIMDQGTDKSGVYPACDPNNGGHSVCALTTPNGYGVE